MPLNAVFQRPSLTLAPVLVRVSQLGGRAVVFKLYYLSLFGRCLLNVIFRDFQIIFSFCVAPASSACRHRINCISSLNPSDYPCAEFIPRPRRSNLSKFLISRGCIHNSSPHQQRNQCMPVPKLVKSGLLGIRAGLPSVHVTAPNQISIDWIF